jgi:hypothetical protein
MGFVVAVLLMGAGLLGPVALAMWHQDRWLTAGEWIRDHVSPPAVVAVPLAGAFVASVGLMVVWPPAFVLAFTAGVALVYQLWTLTREGVGTWYPPALVIRLTAVDDELEEEEIRPRKAG